MSRAAIDQLFRRIPDADDAAIDAAVDALEHGSRDELATRQDIKLLHWMIGILTAIQLGTLWMLFGLKGEMAERFSALEATVRALGGQAGAGPAGATGPVFLSNASSAGKKIAARENMLYNEL